MFCVHAYARIVIDRETMGANGRRPCCRVCWCHGTKQLVCVPPCFDFMCRFVCMCVCIHITVLGLCVCVYVCVYICTNVCMYAYPQQCRYLIYVDLYIADTFIYACISAYIYRHISINICMHTYV